VAKTKTILEIDEDAEARAIAEAEAGRCSRSDLAARRGGEVAQILGLA
jgi:hypothetical protein